MAPAPGLDPALRQALLDDAVKLAKHVGYRWARRGARRAAQGAGSRGVGADRGVGAGAATAAAPSAACLRRRLNRAGVSRPTPPGDRNAGTVEFIVDKHGSHYYMETNPRCVGLRLARCSNLSWRRPAVH